MKICVITTTRAEYGLLRNFLKLIDSSKKFKLDLVVTGSHLSKEFGETIKEIRQDGFKNFEKINIIKNIYNNEINPYELLSELLLKFSKYLKKNKPNLIIVLGDRYELISICYSAVIFKIPICHFHGGESTGGLIDDVTRHAITKFSHIHFTAHKVYKKRVLQMGENPKFVHNIGGMGAENLNSFEYLEKGDLEKKIKFNFINKTCLVTFHPETLSNLSITEQVNGLMKALEMKKDLRIIFTYPNIDPGSKKIIKILKKFTKKNYKRSILIKSLGSKIFYSVLKNVNFVIGNSSSGLLEVPSFKIPTINIGERQEGRLRSKSVIDCRYDYDSITKAIRKALSKSFIKSLKKSGNIYDNGHSSKKAFKILSNIDFNILLKKKFYDIKN